MKLIRFGERGREKPGLLLDGGVRVDVSEAFRDYDEAFFAGGGLADLEEWARAQAATAPRVDADVRLGPPVARPSPDTLAPRSSSTRDRCLPTNPEAPVMRMRLPFTRRRVLHNCSLSQARSACY